VLTTSNPSNPLCSGTRWGWRGQGQGGKKPRGKPPAGPQPNDQINLTDEETRIVPVAGGGSERCYNAQAVVAADSLLVVAAEVVQAADDKQQLGPMLGKLAALPADLGGPQTMLGDNGYFSDANVTACAAARIETLLARGDGLEHEADLRPQHSVRER
jgi:hypothetical protein